MARDGDPTPAPGWCDPALRKHPIERFVSRTRRFDTKRANEAFRVTFQTTPVPLRDRCRCAALPLLISGGESEKRPISSPQDPPFDLINEPVPQHLPSAGEASDPLPAN